MRFEVYCDEENPDVLTSATPRARYLMIGSLWVPAELRGEIKARVLALRQRHAAWGEIKWGKIPREKMRPLIRYAGSAAETSIGSKPMGSELRAEVYPNRHVVQARARNRLSCAEIRLSGRRVAAAQARKGVATCSRSRKLSCPNHLVADSAGNRLGAPLVDGRTEVDPIADGWPQ